MSHRAACLALAIVFGAASLMIGCGGDDNDDNATAAKSFPKEDVTLTMFGSDEAPAFQVEQRLIDQWEKQHPNVTVKAQQTPLGPAFQKLSTQLPTGGGPTIFSVFEPWIEGFYAGGFLASANPSAFGVKDMAGITDEYLPSSLEAQSRDGKVYCLPGVSPAWNLFINKKKFADAGLKIPDDVPETWSEVAKLQPKLKKTEDGRLVQRGFGVRYTAGAQWYSMLFVATVKSEGGEVLDAQGNAQLTTPEALAAMDVFKQNAVAPTITKAVQTSPYQDFASGLDVMSYGGANALSFVEQLNPAMKGNVHVARLPSLTGEVGGSPKYSFDYCVNKSASAEEQFAAWSLINYIVSEGGVTRWNTTGSMSARKSFFEEPSVKEAPFVDVFKQELEDAQALPQTKHWDQLQSAIQNAVQKVIFKDEDPRQALSDAQGEYEQSIGS